MDYEKKYKEALEKARQIHDADRVSGIELTICETIFPELKESEDKKIKKEIISHLKYLGKYCQESMPNVNEWITWIEKQGEQKPVDKVEPKFKVKYAGNEYNVFEVKDIAGVTYYGIEDEPNHIDYVLPDNCEIVSEQKLADMVEPKFKAGDWIVRELDNSVHQVKAVIENISNGKYGYDLTKGGYISSQDANFYHHWTIQDAKDGDVLQLGLVTAIFQEYIGNGKCKCYCSICGDFCIPSQDGDDNSYGCSDAAPATKEQRDILLNAIYEAGYTFDFEKKELKQKPDWSENDKDFMYETLSNLTELKDRYGEGYGNVGKCIEWVKSIKDRVHPQSKQDWTEDDEERVKNIISVLGVQVCWNGATGKKENPYQKEIDWLESLKYQNTWKPSNEQIVALEHFVRSIWESEFASPYNNNIKLVYLLLNQLKKLKE